jgi:hypothetical protein
MREDIMKILLTLVSLAALSGCAVDQPARNNYGARYPAPADPSQWHVVSVTPVAPGTGERLAAESGTGSSVQYTSEPIVPARPLYTAPPLYVAEPVYYAPAPAYYYPPVSIGLDFVFGRSWGGGHHGHGGRNWAGVGVGTRWHR